MDRLIPSRRYAYVTDPRSGDDTSIACRPERLVVTYRQARERFDHA